MLDRSEGVPALVGGGAYSEDRLASLKSEYELAAKAPSNLRYGYVRAA